MKKALIFLLIAAGSGALMLREDRTQDHVLPISLEIPAVLQIEQQRFDVVVPEGSSAYDLMILAEKQYGLSFSGRKFEGLGFFVDEIQGKKQSQVKGKYWIYYINNKKATVGVSQYIIQPHDIISWHYEDDED